MKNKGIPPQGSLTIGTLSERTGCKIETIRYYERIGVMGRPARSAGGYRLYGTDELKRLNFIRRARQLGFGLPEIRALLDFADRKNPSCREVSRLAAGHLADVRSKIKDLKRMERVLERLIADCAGGTLPHCPLLESLFREQAEARDKGDFLSSRR